MTTQARDQRYIVMCYDDGGITHYGIADRDTSTWAIIDDVVLRDFTDADTVLDLLLDLRHLAALERQLEREQKDHDPRSSEGETDGHPGAVA